MTEMITSILPRLAQKAAQWCPAQAKGRQSMTKSLDHLPAEFNRQRVLGAAEAALFLNLSLPHFRRLYRSGGVPAPIQLSSRRFGWQMGVLIEWLEARQTRPVAARAA